MAQIPRILHSSAFHCAMPSSTLDWLRGSATYHTTLTPMSSDKRHKRICFFINTVELLTRCRELDRRTAMMADTENQEWPIDIGRLKTAIILGAKMGTDFKEAHINLYGPDPPRKDTVWRPIAGHNIRCYNINSDSAEAHKPWICGEIIADAIGCLHDIDRNGMGGAFVFISNEPELESAVSRIRRRGFKAQVLSWEHCLHECQPSAGYCMYSHV